jgi:hypothetical protein
MKYKFKWKRFLLPRSKTVVGHRYEKDQDKMVLFFENGGVREIKKWTRCECRLGADWAQAMKKQMEQKAGTTIPTTF